MKMSYILYRIFNKTEFSNNYRKIWFWGKSDCSQQNRKYNSILKKTLKTNEEKWTKI